MRVVKCSNGEPAAYKCTECEADGVACIGVGKGEWSASICMTCARDAYLALAEAKGVSVRLRESPVRKR